MLWRPLSGFPKAYFQGTELLLLVSGRVVASYWLMNPRDFLLPLEATLNLSQLDCPKIIVTFQHIPTQQNGCSSWLFCILRHLELFESVCGGWGGVKQAVLFNKKTKEHLRSYHQTLGLFPSHVGCFLKPFQGIASKFKKWTVSCLFDVPLGCCGSENMAWNHRRCNCNFRLTKGKQ